MLYFVFLNLALTSPAYQEPFPALGMGVHDKILQGPSSVLHHLKGNTEHLKDGTKRLLRQITGGKHKYIRPPILGI